MPQHQPAVYRPMLHLVQTLSQTRNQIGLWATRYQTRKALARLDNRLLQDVGLTLDQQKQESRTPFWRT